MSVVIPTRDRWHWLRESLAMALGQEGVAVEVVVVDDGSRDNTSDRLASMHESRLRVIRHAQSQGLSRARNAGIAHARGDWVAFLDDDDLWSPRKLRAQLDAADAANASWAYAGALLVDERRRAQESVPFPDPDELQKEVLARNRVPVGSSNVVVRADLLRRIGAFDEQLGHLADWDLWIRLAGAGPPAACAEVLVGYTMHAHNMHSADSAAAYAELRHLTDKHAAECAARGLEVDRAWFARWVAWGHRRAGRRAAAARVYFDSAVRDRSASNARGAIRAPFGVRPLRPWRRPPPVQEPEWLMRLRRP